MLERNIWAYMAGSIVDMGGLAKLAKVLSYHSVFSFRRFYLPILIGGLLSHVEIQSAGGG